MRRAHLAEDLALAGDERVEPGRDAEEVQRGRVVAQAVERRLHLGLELGERRDGGSLRGVDVRCGEVELRAVARREAHGFAAVRRQPLRKRRRGVAIERDALAQLERSVVVRGADEDEAHHEKWAAGRASRTTMTSAKPTSAT